MEQILLNQLTSLKRSSLRILLRCNSKKMPFYRGQLMQGFINNNINLEIIEDRDEMFPLEKVQVISQSQLSNGYRNHETIFNGTYSLAFVEYVIIFCKQKLYFRESDININLKFKIEPIIRFKNNFDLKGINEKRNHRQKKHEQNSKRSEQQEDSKNAKKVRKSSSNFNGKSSPRNDEDIDRDNSQYHGRRCFCCSNRSPQQSELTLSRSYSRSPVNNIQSSQIQERKNKISNFSNEKRISSNFKNHQKSNAIQRGKSSQSDRKQKSNNLYFNNHHLTSSNQQQESSSFKAPNKIQFRNLHKRRQNETCSESNNKWVKTKRQDDAFSRASQFDQDKKTQPKTNLQVKKHQNIKITRNPFRQTSNNQKSSNTFFHSTILEGDHKNNLNQVQSTKTSFIHIAKQMEQRFSQMGATIVDDESENQTKLNFQSKTGRIIEPKKYHHERKNSFEDDETNILTNNKDGPKTNTKIGTQISLARKNKGTQGQKKQRQNKIGIIKQFSEARNSRNGLFEQQKPSKASKIRKIPLNQKMQMIKQMQAVKANEHHEEAPKMKQNDEKPASMKEKQQQNQIQMKQSSQKFINGFEFKENQQVYQSKQIQLQNQPKRQKVNDEKLNQQNLQVQYQKNVENEIQGYEKHVENENDFSVTHQRVNEQYLQLSRNRSKLNDQSPNLRQDDLASTRKQIKYESLEEEDGLNQYDAVLPANIHQVRETASAHTSRTIPYNSSQLQNQLVHQNFLQNHNIPKQDEQQFFDDLFMNNLEEEPQQASEEKLGRSNEVSMKRQNTKVAVSSKDFINSQTILEVNRQLPTSGDNFPALSLKSDLASQQKSQYSQTSQLKVGQQNRSKLSRNRMSINSFQSFPANLEKLLHSSETEIVNRQQRLKDQCSSQPCKSFESLQRFQKQLFDQQSPEPVPLKKLQKPDSYKLNKANIKDCLRLDTIDEVNQSIYRKNQRQLSKDSISLNSSKIGSPIIGPGLSLKQATSFTDIKEQALLESQNHNNLPQQQNFTTAPFVQKVTQSKDDTAKKDSSRSQQLKSKNLCLQNEKSQNATLISKVNTKQDEDKTEIPIVNEIHNDTQKDLNEKSQSKASINNKIETTQESKCQLSGNLVKNTNFQQNNRLLQQAINYPTSNSNLAQCSPKENSLNEYPIQQNVQGKRINQPNRNELIKNGQQQKLSNEKISKKRIQIIESDLPNQIKKDQQFSIVNKQNDLNPSLIERKQQNRSPSNAIFTQQDSKHIQQKIKKDNVSLSNNRMDNDRQVNQVQIPKLMKQKQQQLDMKNNEIKLQHHQQQSKESKEKKQTEYKLNTEDARQNLDKSKKQILREKMQIQEVNSEKSIINQTHNKQLIKEQHNRIHQQKSTGQLLAQQNNQKPLQTNELNYCENNPQITQKYHAKNLNNKNLSSDKKRIQQIKPIKASQQHTKTTLPMKQIKNPPVQNRNANEVQDKIEEIIKKDVNISSKAKDVNQKIYNTHQNIAKSQQIEKMIQIEIGTQVKNEENISEKVNKPRKTLISTAEVQTDYFLPIDNEGDNLEANKQEASTKKISSVHSEKKKCTINLCEPQIFNPAISQYHSNNDNKLKAALKRKNRNKIQKKNDNIPKLSKTVAGSDEINGRKVQSKHQDIPESSKIMQNNKLEEQSSLMNKEAVDKSDRKEEKNEQCLEQIQNIFKDKQQDKEDNVDKIQQLHLNFKDSLNIHSNNPSILDRLIYKKFTSIVFQRGQMISEGKQKKLQIINNSLQFIRRNLPWLQSELINETKTQACLFINNQWILFTQKQKNQCLDLALLLLVNLQQASVYRCIQMLTGMPIRILKDKQRTSDNKRLLKSVNALLEKRQEQSLQKAHYGINKMCNQVVLLQKVRHFLDKHKQNKTILECMRINSSKKPQIFNLQSQNINQFVQMFILEDPKYLLLELDKDVINTYEIELDSVIFYISGHYKFNLYEQTQRNQYMLVQQSYMWIKHKNHKKLTKYLLVIEPIPNKQGQPALMMRLATSSKQGSKTNRIVKYESGGESKQFKGGYENKKNLYLPVVKEISKKAK